MTFLEYTFSSGWHFVGMVLLLSMGILGIGMLTVIAAVIAEIVRVFWRKP
jgi:hypothetical protein